MKCDFCFLSRLYGGELKVPKFLLQLTFLSRLYGGEREFQFVVL